ncbi:MAG: hypothetical protein BWZ10_03438 [candidate division BRC1 bacterium ADurb.BinA364]|nr:MAG: hypothetical protein BWZ10_03438 [candidate division BRC1 bacterium ADurb.BinA364]
MIGIAGSKKSVNWRKSRVLAWPRKPSSKKSCRASSALTTCGMTVSPYPIRPGNSGSRLFSFRRVFSRNSSRMLLNRYPCRFNSPSVDGAAMAPPFRCASQSRMRIRHSNRGRAAPHANPTDKRWMGIKHFSCLLAWRKNAKNARYAAAIAEREIRQLSAPPPHALMARPSLDSPRRRTLHAAPIAAASAAEDRRRD